MLIYTMCADHTSYRVVAGRCGVGCFAAIHCVQLVVDLRLLLCTECREGGVYRVVAINCVNSR